MKFEHFVYSHEKGELLDTQTGQALILRQKLNNLLHYLICHRDRVLSKEDILTALWAHAEFRENALTQSIRELRQTLGDSAQNPRFIQTFQQRGYQWIANIEEAKPGKLRVKLTAFSAIAVTILIAVCVWQMPRPDPANTRTGNIDSLIDSLLVLPFTNDSLDPKFNWVELGLADMLAVELQRKGTFQITPPAAANILLLDNNLTWPALHDDIRGILKTRDIDVALIASFRLHNQQQVLDFRLLFRNGQTRQGAMTYPSLPEESQAIAAQLMHLLNIDDNSPASESNTQAELAWLAVAEGMSALQTSGPLQAHDFFQAAHLLLKNEDWVLAYLAQSELMIGHWQEAEAHLRTISTESQDASLLAFRSYLLAELAFRAGKDNEVYPALGSAIAHAQKIQNIQVLADGYRLYSRMAWLAHDWDQHHYYLNKANALFPRSSDLRIEAEKLFYLGNPVAYGLEKDPQQNLLLSQERVRKALNFYQQLSNQPAVAASYFALAQNYKLPLPEREHALKETIARYRKLGQPFELSEALIYAAFYHLQLRQGTKALIYLEQAKPLIQQQPEHRLSNEWRFYQAFALLDSGLDQRHLGLHAKNDNYLRQAQLAFEQLLEDAKEGKVRADSLILLAWADIALGQENKALAALKEAEALYLQFNMPVTHGYSIFSQMYIHLQNKNYQEVIALGSNVLSTRKQFQYLARAYYEMGQLEQALEVFKRLKLRDGLWLESDEQRLAIYEQSLQNATQFELPDEEPVHSIYCEEFTL